MTAHDMQNLLCTAHQKPATRRTTRFLSALPCGETVTLGTRPGTRRRPRTAATDSHPTRRTRRAGSPCRRVTRSRSSRQASAREPRPSGSGSRDNKLGLALAEDIFLLHGAQGHESPYRFSIAEDRRRPQVSARAVRPVTDAPPSFKSTPDPACTSQAAAGSVTRTTLPRRGAQTDRTQGCSQGPHFGHPPSDVPFDHCCRQQSIGRNLDGQVRLVGGPRPSHLQAGHTVGARTYRRRQQSRLPAFRRL